MRLLAKIILAVLGNFAGLLLAAHYVPGFALAGTWTNIILLALALTLLNALLRPILRLFLGPLIILTLGVGSILVNVVILALLAYLAPTLIIQGVVPLLEGTLVLAAANFIIHLLTGF